MRFFALPSGGLAQEDFVIDRRRVAWGDLFFESPTGLWDPGTYSLVVQGDETRALLPIDLD